MNVKPAPIAIVLATLATGCSSLPGAPSQYVTLPASDVDLGAIPIAEDDGAAITTDHIGSSRSTAAKAVRRRVAVIDPLVILQSKATLQMELPGIGRTRLFRAPVMADPSTTASLTDSSSTGIGSPGAGIQNYDREAVMERLFARGKKAVLPICEGC